MLSGSAQGVYHTFHLQLSRILVENIPFPVDPYRKQTVKGPTLVA